MIHACVLNHYCYFIDDLKTEIRKEGKVGISSIVVEMFLPRLAPFVDLSGPKLQVKRSTLSPHYELNII